MRSVKFLVAAGAALLPSMASAADVPMPPPPPGYAVAPPPVGYAVAQPPMGYAGGYAGGGGQGGGEEFTGWYLRGDISFNSQRTGRMNNALDTNTTSSSQSSQFSSGGGFSGGGGYRFNNWFRGDFTGEFRASSQFSASDRITFNGGHGMDLYRGNFQEWVIMGNAYVDLGTWFSLTPFVGAGIGGARVSVMNFIDQGISSFGTGSVSSTAFGNDTSRWNLAWALHGGIAYKIAQNFTIELAYRYLNMGDALSGDLQTFDGTNLINNPMTFRNLHSHDIKFGVRWDLCLPPSYAAPLYAPIAPQPPLMRRG